MRQIITIALIALASCVSNRPTTIYLAGDSTMANKPVEDNPERGWGQLLPKFFDASVVVENHAKNGRSTKSFIDEGRWDSLICRVKKGDYVFIQFGHNDSKKDDPKRFADPYFTYRNNLIRFVEDCRRRKAKPILITPVVRRRFDENGNFYDVHGDYLVVVKEVAETYRVPLIDLNGKSAKLVSDYGPERSKELYLHIAPGVYKSLPDGKRDDTHFSELGATKIAGLVVEGIIELDIDLVKHLNIGR